MIEIKEISKKFFIKNSPIEVIKNLSYTFHNKTFYAIMGHSGSGKTTLINILGLLTKPDSGHYLINNQLVDDYTNQNLAKLRKELIGFIFQDYCHDENLTAYENVMLPLLINKQLSKDEKEKIVNELFLKLNLDSRKKHYPHQMSGGECQRVAIARALVNNPSIILADEPTGNLDTESEKNIFHILQELSKSGKCVIVVSHSQEVKKYADQVLILSDGKLENANENN